MTTNYERGNVKYKISNKYEFCTNELVPFNKCIESKIQRCKDLCLNHHNCIYYKQWLQSESEE